jgi:hypothetical protein
VECCVYLKIGCTICMSGQVHCYDEFATCQLSTFAAMYGAMHHREPSTLVNRNLN